MACVLIACGNDHGTPIDVDAPPPPGTPIVTITAPRMNDSFYVTQSVTVTWSVMDDGSALTCDVAAIGTAQVAIMSNVAVTSGANDSATWTLSGVTPGPYQIQIACRDDASLTGSAKSAQFTVTAAPQDVSFSSQLVPLLARCSGAACHDAQFPQDGLDLTAANAYADVFDQPSAHCPAYKLVAPSDPNNSYLIFKIQGSGPCYVGSRMPKPPETLFSVEEI